MRILLQRVRQAAVAVEGKTVASIGAGLLALTAFGEEDGPEFGRSPAFLAMARKMLELRIFPGTAGKEHLLDRNVLDFGGQVLMVPQFTLYADCRKGRRPSFSHAGHPQWARPMYEDFVTCIDEMCGGGVSSGIFGADMDVALCNWGPVTIWLDSAILAGTAQG